LPVPFNPDLPFPFDGRFRRPPAQSPFNFRRFLGFGLAFSGATRLTLVAVPNQAFLPSLSGVTTASGFGRIIAHGPQRVRVLGSVSSAPRVLAKEKRKIFVMTNGLLLLNEYR
jgi:hypothetical protein